VPPHRRPIPLRHASGLVDLHAAAIVLGVSLAQVRALIAAGRLSTISIGRETRVPLAEVEALSLCPAPVGRARA
jgi:excisionase family DNA binding protein